MIVKKRKVVYGLSTLGILLSAGFFPTLSLASMDDYRTGYTGYGSRLSHEIDTAALLQIPSQDVLSGMEILEEASLAQLRGGFSLAGMDMNFGATLRTRIDDIRMETVMKFSPIEEEIITRTHSNIDSAFKTAKVQVASRFETGKSKPSESEQNRRVTQVGPSSGRSLPEVASRAFALAGLKDLPGTVVDDTKGFTAVLQDITRNSILSAVVGTASGRKIHQELDIRIDISNIEALKPAQLRSRIASSLRF